MFDPMVVGQLGHCSLRTLPGVYTHFSIPRASSGCCCLHAKIHVHFSEPRTMSHTPHPIEKLLQQRILILDGAMGTMIQRHKLTEAHYRGTELYGDYAGERRNFADHPVDLKGCIDLLLLTQPHVVG